MNIGIIKDTICTNIAVFEDMATAVQFLEMGALGDADTVVAVPDEYSIGDTYKNGVWEKAPSITAGEIDEILQDFM